MRTNNNNCNMGMAFKLSLSLTDKIKLLKGKKCCIYNRVSTKSQTKGMSLEAQKQICTDYAKKVGLKVEKLYSEDASARYPGKRKLFEAMLKAQSTKEKVDVMIFPMVDRMSRNNTDADKLFELAKKQKLILVFIQENVIVIGERLAHEKLLLNILTVVSDFRVDHDRENCMIGSQKRAQTGFRPTKCPYGYKNDTRKHRTLVIKSRANFVKAAFEMYATGEYSLMTLPEALYEKGLRYTLQPTGIIPKQTLNSMLKNIFYTGKFTFTGTEGLIEGNHEPIVSDELFDKVQAMLGEPPIEVRRYQHMYSKVIQCKLCGNHMIGDKKVKPSGKEYVYYRCMNKKCPNGKGGTNQNDIDKAIEDYFREIRLNEIPKDIISTAIKEALAELKQRKSTLKRNESRKFHAELNHKEFIKANEIEDEKYIQEGFEEIKNKYSNIAEELESVENQIKFLTEIINATFTKRLSEVYVTLSDTAKIEVIQLVKNNLTLNNKKLKMTFKRTFQGIRRR